MEDIQERESWPSEKKTSIAVVSIKMIQFQIAPWSGAHNIFRLASSNLMI